MGKTLNLAALAFVAAVATACKAETTSDTNQAALLAGTEARSIEKFGTALRRESAGERQITCSLSGLDAQTEAHIDELARGAYDAYVEPMRGLCPAGKIPANFRLTDGGRRLVGFLADVTAGVSTQRTTANGGTSTPHFEDRLWLNGTSGDRVEVSVGLFLNIPINAPIPREQFECVDPESTATSSELRSGLPRHDPDRCVVDPTTRRPNEFCNFYDIAFYDLIRSYIRGNVELVCSAALIGIDQINTGSDGVCIAEESLKLADDMMLRRATAECQRFNASNQENFVEARSQGRSVPQYQCPRRDEPAENICVTGVSEFANSEPLATVGFGGRVNERLQFSPMISIQFATNPPPWAERRNSNDWSCQAPRNTTRYRRLVQEYRNHIRQLQDIRLCNDPVRPHIRIPPELQQGQGIGVRDLFGKR